MGTDILADFGRSAVLVTQTCTKKVMTGVDMRDCRLHTVDGWTALVEIYVRGELVGISKCVLAAAENRLAADCVISVGNKSKWAFRCYFISAGRIVALGNGQQLLRLPRAADWWASNATRGRCELCGAANVDVYQGYIGGGALPGMCRCAICRRLPGDSDCRIR